jgi:outer membrane protein
VPVSRYVCEVACCFLLCVSVSVSVCSGQEAETGSANPVLTLDEAVSLAKKQNSQIQVSALDVSKAIEQTNQTKTQRLPVFKIYVNAGLALVPINLTIPKATLGVYPGIGPIPAEDAPIKTPRQITAFINGQASQPLLQLYKVGLALKEARVGEQLAREKLRQETLETTQQVKQAYYQFTQIQSQIASAEIALKYLEELSAYTELNLAQETVLKADALSVKAKMSQQRYQLLTLRDNLDSQKEAFNRLLGRDLRTSFTVEPEPLPSRDEISLSAAQSKALAQRPELRQARLQVQKTELDVRRERAEYLPDLSLNFSYLSFPNVNFFPKNVAVAGVLLEWQPFDWGFKKHKIDELRSTSKQAVLTEHDAQQQVLIDVNSSYRKLAETRALLDAQAAAQEAERENLRVVMNRYKDKSALLTDVLQQQNTLGQADAQYQQALSSFWTAKATFERALGEQ